VNGKNNTSIEMANSTYTDKMAKETKEVE